MASSIPANKTSHLERTAAEPRDQFLPGQWLDVFVPGISRAGGFTITSPPSLALQSEQPGYLELAVQKSPGNPPAAWLWQDPPASLLGSDLQVRVGGSFVWPPPGLAAATTREVMGVRRIVLVAGGVGINPLVSMLSALAEDGDKDLDVRFLYSLRDPGPAAARDPARLLFLERIAEVFASGQVRGGLQLYLTGGGAEKKVEDGTIAWKGGEIPFRGRRITRDDLREAVGEDREQALVYVCGVPRMTDEFVEWLKSGDGLGMDPERVLCEKWW
ncbi:hypothetical protein LQW54_005580 [Pestalotiopsis sp. IQ-011]